MMMNIILKDYNFGNNTNKLFWKITQERSNMIGFVSDVFNF